VKDVVERGCVPCFQPVGIYILAPNNHGPLPKTCTLEGNSSKSVNVRGEFVVPSRNFFRRLLEYFSQKKDARLPV